MMSSGINLVMTVIGFAVSVLFIVFVCTRLIWARIQLNAARRAFARASRSDLSTLERGVNGLDPLVVSNLPTKKYGELCFSSQENSQCTVCLADYNNEDRLRVLPICGHSFHATCIDRWLQQHSTCPVCRISLREIPDRKWFMQPMFCSAVRSQQHSMPSVNPYCCRCMGNGTTHSPRSLDNQIMEPPAHEDRQGNTVNSQLTKESANQKIESASEQ